MNAQRIGMLGAGQLARMLTSAATPLGIEIFCQDPTKEISAKNFHPCLNADYDNLNAIDQLLANCDRITFENENIPISTAEYIHQQQKLFPSPQALYYSQDRLFEKQFLQSHQIKTASFYPVDDLATFKKAAEALSFPLLLKTRRFGYDGKGQYLIKTLDEGIKIIEDLTNHHKQEISLIAESIVSFHRELSIIAARSSKNTSDIVFYPLVENHHHAGILRISRSPLQSISPNLQSQAEKIALTLLNSLDYSGVLSIEFFETSQGLLVNEIAPRVHNSGHWTIEGAHTSQFENHLRAISDLPLGNTQAKGFSIMINIIGTFPDLSELLAIPFCHVHDYQKSPRPFRKLGHITLNHEDPEFLETLLMKNEPLQKLLREP